MFDAPGRSDAFEPGDHIQIDVRLDDKGIVTEAPDIDGLFHCAGFSGHGIVQSPTIGVIMADLIRRGGTAVEVMGLLAEEEAKWAALFARTGRNDPCPCGSGLKYKKCCLAKLEKEEARRAERDQAGMVAVKWGLWSALQAKISTIPFDYGKYSNILFMRGRALMREWRWEAALQSI